MADPIQSSWWRLVYDTWPLDRVEVFDLAVDAFESSWQVGKPTQIDSILQTIPEVERPVWLMELIAIELIARWGQGDAVSLDDLQKRFPKDAAIIQSVWTEISPNLETLLTKTSIAEKSCATIEKRHIAFQPGDVLDGRFRIDKFVKRGGMAELYRAQRISDNYAVAIKLFRPALVNMRFAVQLEERFIHENEILRQQRHPHLLAALELIRGPNQPLAIVLDWIDGRDLEEEIAFNGPMPWPDAALAISQISDGLGWAWRKYNLVHRDIKPSNLMLKRDGDMVVLDFGLSRVMRSTVESEQPRLTTHGEIFGTPDYMAPEQSDDSRDVTASADVYSLGCTLFYLLTGFAPFSFGEAAQLTRKEAHRRLSPPDVRTFCPSVPVEIAQLIQQMLAKEPKDRLADGAAVAEALKPWTHGSDLKRRFEGHLPIYPLSAKVTKRNLIDRRIATIIAICILLLTLIAGFWQFTTPRSTLPSLAEFRVSLYRGGGTNSLPERVGEIGSTAYAAQSGNLSQLRIRFSTPVYIQMFAIDGSGKIAVLVDSSKDSSIAQNVILSPTDFLIFPIEGFWQLEEVGLSAIVLVANRKPLPPSEKLQAALASSIDWARTHSISGVWKSDGGSIQLLISTNERPRDRLVQITPEPLKLLRDSIKKTTDENTIVELIAFPVVD